MAKKNRDYKAEYARRIARGKKRGLTKSQSRGHPKPGEKSIRSKPQNHDALLEKALRFMRQTGTQKAAAKMAGVSTERLRRFTRDNGLAERKGSKWIFTDNRGREMASYINGRPVQLKLPDFDTASLNGEYLAAVERFLATNDYSHIRPFIGKSVRDASGKRHFFETDPNELYQITSGDEPFEQIYRFIN